MSGDIQSLLQDDLILAVLPVFLAACALEAWHSARKGLGWYEASDVRASLIVMLVTGAVDLLPKLAGVWAMFALHDISPLRDVIGRQWWAWCLLFVLDDVTYYWFHRGNHTVRLMWAGHVNHHSSRYMNLGTALRQGVGERAIKYVFWLWLPLLGFDPAMVVTMLSISLFYQFWLHTPLIGKLHPLIEFVLNTPSHHRVHHGSNVRYLDRNHGATLILWDRLFGTFSAEIDEEPVVYGLTKNNPDNTASTVLLREVRGLVADLRRARDWRDRMRYLFRAPGWSHDGPDLRSETLRSRAAATA